VDLVIWLNVDRWGRKLQLVTLARNPKFPFYRTPKVILIIGR
jgi:hypothetical protein